MPTENPMGFVDYEAQLLLQRLQEEKKLREILEANKHMDFIQRINQIGTGEEYQWIPGPEGEGRSTHSMATGEADGSYYVFPTVQADESGQLKRYGFKDGEAMRRAIEMGEAIPFQSQQEAEWFSKNYKMLWPEETR